MLFLLLLSATSGPNSAGLVVNSFWCSMYIVAVARGTKIKKFSRQRYPSFYNAKGVTSPLKMVVYKTDPQRHFLNSRKPYRLVHL